MRLKKWEHWFVIDSISLYGQSCPLTCCIARLAFFVWWWVLVCLETVSPVALASSNLLCSWDALDLWPSCLYLLSAGLQVCATLSASSIFVCLQRLFLSSPLTRGFSLSESTPFAAAWLQSCNDALPVVLRRLYVLVSKMVFNLHLFTYWFLCFVCVCIGTCVQWGEVVSVEFTNTLDVGSLLPQCRSSLGLSVGGKDHLAPCLSSFIISFF